MLFTLQMFVYFKVKEIEKQDSVLTPKQQIDRLTRPGATYFNLNPFDVSRLLSTFHICCQDRMHQFLYAVFGDGIILRRFNTLVMMFGGMSNV